MVNLHFRKADYVPSDVDLSISLDKRLSSFGLCFLETR